MIAARVLWPDRHTSADVAGAGPERQPDRHGGRAGTCGVGWVERELEVLGLRGNAVGVDEERAAAGKGSGASGPSGVKAAVIGPRFGSFRIRNRPHPGSPSGWHRGTELGRTKREVPSCRHPG